MQIRKLYSFSHCLFRENKIVLVRSLSLSRLDYCKSLHASANKKVIDKLQRVQNGACKFANAYFVFILLVSMYGRTC